MMNERPTTVLQAHGSVISIIVMKLIIQGCVYHQVSNQPACTISSANPTQLCRRALRPESSVANLSNKIKIQRLLSELRTQFNLP